MKKFITYLIILAPWFLSSLLFKDSLNFFDSINVPFFALPKWSYGIAWGILYLLISFNIYKIITKNKFKDIKDYYLILLINYIFNQLYLFLFFYLKSTFLGLVDSILILISSLYLYLESKEIDEYNSKYLIPYIIFNIYASILSLTIYFINL